MTAWSSATVTNPVAYDLSCYSNQSRLSWVKVLTKTFTLYGIWYVTLETEKTGSQKLTLKLRCVNFTLFDYITFWHLTKLSFWQEYGFTIAICNYKYTYI